MCVCYNDFIKIFQLIYGIFYFTERGMERENETDRERPKNLFKITQ